MTGNTIWYLVPLGALGLFLAAWQLAAYLIARRSAPPGGCIFCRAKAGESDSRRQIERRSQIENRAKACFEILARTGIGIIGDIWEAEHERTREAFRAIVDYMEYLAEEDEADRGEEQREASK